MKYEFPAWLLLLPITLWSAQVLAVDDYCNWKPGLADGKKVIEKPLCGLAGNAASGRAVAIDRGRGNCLSCHGLPVPEEDFHGQIGPPLHAVALRYSQGEIRMRLVDAAEVNPATIMPGFYRHPDKNHRLAAIYEGKTLLTAQQIEDLVSYLVTLKRNP